MWAGNVPSDATHDELWRFFNNAGSPVPSADSAQDPSSAAASSTAPSAPGQSQGGVLSIFLIQRSNCAFVNFQTEAHLHAAIAYFNGKPLRPLDPRCPRLVCRVRGREDDLKAGVGGQRGAGIHVRWIKDQRQKQAENAVARLTGSPEPSPSEKSAASAASSATSDAAGMMASLSLSSDDEGHGRKWRKQAQHSSSSGSYASTNSSLLSQYFPKRYFILKSLTQVSVSTRLFMRALSSCTICMLCSLFLEAGVAATLPRARDRNFSSDQLWSPEPRFFSPLPYLRARR